jgi:hypothetical protein
LRNAFPILFAVLSLAVSHQASAGSLVLTFGERSVTVDGVTPGGDVVIFAVAKEPSSSAPPVPMKTGHAVVLRDNAHEGRVVLTRERTVPLIAIWVAIDIASGRWTASGSPGFEAQALPSEEFAKRDGVGQLRKISALVPEMEALLVRPGTGAWRLYSAKTSGTDENGRDALALQIDVGQMVPLSDRLPKLDSIHQGDILALLEPQSMRLAVVEVSK